MKKPIPIVEVTRRLRLLRLARGFSLNELSDRADISRVYIHKLEKDSDINPTLAFLQRLCVALDVSMPALFLPHDHESGVKAIEVATEVLELTSDQLDEVRDYIQKFRKK